MLPAARRVVDGSEIGLVVRRGRRRGTPRLVVHHLSGDHPARFGFVVSKAVGGAVVRNRVKRRLRHLAAARLFENPALSGDVVVRALPASASASYAELGADLARGLPALAVAGGAGAPGGQA